ncbi:MAG TPA: RHS repeat-associated core domain-containing protein [Vicinamibacterales bacterium]|nr:RHS repeat-associated core domain-containing protein [Vicinamibacterales bacterium]
MRRMLEARVRRLAAALFGLALLALPSVAAAQSETVEYYGTDAAGSVRVVFDAGGNIISRMDYTPFGQELFSGLFAPEARFGGQTTDEETAQSNFHARQYQARTGRFMRTDPVFDGLFDPQAWNRYAYARNSPMTFIDPYGEQFKSSVNGCESVPREKEAYGAWVYACAQEVADIGLGSDGGTLSFIGMEPLPPYVGGGSLGGPGRSKPSPTDPNVPPPPPPGPNPPGPNPPGPQPPGQPPSFVNRLRCAADTSDQYSIAGLAGTIGKQGLLANVFNGFAGNTVAGLVKAVSGGGNYYRFQTSIRNLGLGLTGKAINLVTAPTAMTQLGLTAETVGGELAGKGLGLPIALAKGAYDLGFFSAAYLVACR